MTVRATLQATDAHFVLLLDGLNELSRTHREAGLGAIHRHMDEFCKHTVHLTCRTADFDQAQAEAQLPDDIALWEVQQLADAIRHWGDDEGDERRARLPAPPPGRRAGATPLRTPASG